MIRLQRTARPALFLTDRRQTKLLAGKRQQGVAIITALLIVTIAATISITISTRLQLDVRRTSNLIASDQADFYLLAAEEWSQRILRKDKKDSTVDNYGEDWALELPPLPVAGGTIQGKLTDLHSCINVNSLLENGKTDPITEQRLQRLFQNLGITNNLSQAINDWIDSDLQTSNPDGAEDVYYLNLENPYRTANTPLLSISELRLIKGFEDSKIYHLVKNHLCAYPTEQAASINVNTATPEVLKSLSSKMTDDIVNNIVSQRDDKPFNDIAEFTSFNKLDTIISDTERLTTSSNYFLLRTQAIIGQANKVMYSVIHRDEKGNTRIIARTFRVL